MAQRSRNCNRRESAWRERSKMSGFAPRSCLRGPICAARSELLEHIPLESTRFERYEYAPAFESGAISWSNG
jgi:hypothetical protein